LTLRARLTLLYTSVLVGVLLVFGVTVFVLLSVSLIRQVEDTLQRTADDILRASQVQISGIPLAALQLELDLTANIFVQVFDETGKLQKQTMNIGFEDRPFDESTLATKVPIFSTVLIEGNRFRVLTVPVTGGANDQVNARLQLAVFQYQP